MRSKRCIILLVCWLGGTALGFGPAPARGDVTAKKVLDSIDRAKRYLLRKQRADGSFQANDLPTYKTGITSLVLLALMNGGMTPAEPEIERGLNYLRSLKSSPDQTYEISLMVMALAAAKDPRRDSARMGGLVKQLEDLQIKRGDNGGSWSYGSKSGGLDLGGDRSNGQFAVLALREAQEAGVPVSIDTWRRARKHWEDHQNLDGGWGYSGNQSSIGSMTVAGIATMVITEAMVHIGEADLNPDESPRCCGEPPPHESVDRGARWLGRNFAISSNPHSHLWYLYYLYGLERAGRLSGRRFFGEAMSRHDWYREGASFLLECQGAQGSWRGVGSMEADEVVGTALALLFLTKGLCPVAINKLEYGPRNPATQQVVDQVWNSHPDDVRNLTQLISGLPKWPRLVTWQVVDIGQADISDLLQAPILFLSGSRRPQFSPAEVGLLREYISNGGFIFAEKACQGNEFEEGFRDLVKQMYPNSEARLKPLTAEHPIYRSEYLMDSSLELWGVDVGCRTSIIYSPHDFACLWDKWTTFEVPNRSPKLVSMITKAMHMGVNIVAYATGREPPMKQLDELARDGQQATRDVLERGYLQIAKVRHTGGWDAAPQALKNLLMGLDKTAGVVASLKEHDINLLDPSLAKFPVLYMHGRNGFSFSQQEQERLRAYLQRGGALFADACCAAPQFDRSFRQLMEQLFPEQKLKRIPPNHEMFTSELAFDVRQVKRRELDVNESDAAIRANVRTVEPFLEGIEYEGKFVVIYSRYDISCALERQASVACAGYVPEDALRLAVNVVLYLMLQ